LVFAVVVVLVSGLAVILIDAGNMLGLRSQLAGGDLEVGLLYFYLYKDGGPVELVQWFYLAAFTLIAAHLSGRFAAEDGDASRFWLFGAILGILMVLEDTGDVRHLLADVGVHVLPLPSSVARTLIEVAFYALIATPALLAALLYGRLPVDRRPRAALLVPGVVFYAIAAIASATRAIGNWYVHAGHWVHERMMGGNLPAMPDGFWGVADGRDVTAFMMMDFILEESIELMGAAFLLAAAIHMVTHRSRFGPMPSVPLAT
jgi:hypothetical protein